jgi:pimeloyl-ACP methyl ester carboxylesterase
MTGSLGDVVSTSDGRDLDVSETNPTGEITVLVHNGTPASRVMMAGWERAATRLGVRLISFNRPGYGDSTRRRGRTVADVVNDSETVLARFSSGPVATIGVSGGGPHALACGALMGDRIAAVAALCSVAPFDADGLDFYAGMSADNVEEFGAAAEGEDVLTEALEPLARAMTQGEDSDEMREALAGLMSPPDVAVLDEALPDLMEGTIEGVRNGVAGWVDDDLAFVAPWGFAPAAVDVPVLLLHGEQDLFVPPAHARWMGERIPNVDLRVMGDQAHLSLSVLQFGTALEWLVQQLG